MAYGETLNPNRRAATLAAVTAIHLALGYALVTGLSWTGLIKPEDVFTAVPIATDTPPPDTHPTVKPTENLIDPAPSPSPIIDVAPTGGLFTPTPLDTFGTGGIDTVIFPTPTPIGTPSFAPVGVKPIGKPTLWVTTDDYPGNDLRLNHEGLTRIALTVSVSGKVENCAVTASSGFPTLDAAACAKLTQRAKFKPGSDSTGAPAGGRYATSVKWEIPQER